MVAGRVDEDLRLALQPAERLRVHDPVAVALERRADGRLLFRTQASARLVRADGERREPGLLLLPDPRLESLGDGLHVLTLDDDRDGASVRAPRRARDIRGTLRAQKSDHRGDLLGLGEPPERTSG